ncbi:hypothetical protein [Alteromonas sp. 14N.309.X.WAT.G.H12]|uniref:hypothetical protein n=1 Tax=Alteromonas sp. 14N.309.X.WAT.G.H12 TaxID=3120824 RepID=UPI002FD3A98B
MKTWSVCILAASISTVAIAEEPEAGNKFAKIDRFLASQSSLVEKSKSGTLVKKDARNVVQPSENAFPAKPAKEVSAATVETRPEEPPKVLPKKINSVENTLLMDLPPASQFIFKEGVYLSANKRGKLFLRGGDVYDIDETASIRDVAELVTSREKSTCALLSNKSNIMMRGDDNSGRPPTYLEVSKISLNEYPSGPLYIIDFESKPPKNVQQDTSVNISLMCSVPKNKESAPESVNLADLNTTFDGLFEFKVSMYIEI